MNDIPAWVSQLEEKNYSQASTIMKLDFENRHYRSYILETDQEEAYKKYLESLK